MKKIAKSNGETNPLRIPAKLLAPIGDFLTSRLKSLEARRSGLDREDPFVNGREENLASPDTVAAEQFGHARADALKRELDRKIVQMRKAFTRVKIGQYGICEECNNLIDTDRLVIYPEATFCIKCEGKREKR